MLELGPRKRRILEALGAHHGDAGALNQLIARGRVVMLGARKSARYALRGRRS